MSPLLGTLKCFTWRAHLQVYQLPISHQRLCQYNAKNIYNFTFKG